MKKEKNLKKQLAEFEAGKYVENYDEPWYDWFCKEASLKGKTVSLFGAVKSFLKVVKVDTTKTYVFFKNNCGGLGLYDDFRICDLKTRDVIWTVAPRHPEGRGEFSYSVWGSANNFFNPIFEGSRKEAFVFLASRFGKES